MQKLYCYVDETGQDTRGSFFLVSTLVLGTERDELGDILEAIEQQSSKGKVKWMKSRDKARQVYIEAILAERACQGRLAYAVYRNSTDYLRHTAATTQRAIARQVIEPDYKATIVVDGLEGKQEQNFRNLIREYGVRFKTVRGVKDEANAFVRLADMLSGFVRAGLHDHEIYAPLLRQALEKQHILQL